MITIYDLFTKDFEEAVVPAWVTRAKHLRLERKNNLSTQELLDNLSEYITIYQCETSNTTPEQV